MFGRTRKATGPREPLFGPTKTVGHAAFTIIIKEGMVLFVRHAEKSQNPTGTYGLPGGRIRSFESPIEAAAREVFEETGLRAIPSNLTSLGTHSVDIETKRGIEAWTVTLHLCRKFQGQIQAREEKEEPVWLSISDVLAGKYKLPQMSNAYLSLILDTLHNQAQTPP